MKRILTLALMVVVAFTAIGIPSHPAAAQTATSPATMMPADTAFYAEVNTGKLNDVITMFAGILSKAGVPLTADQVYSSIDQALSQALKHNVSFQTDIQSWLGDRAGVGVEITPAMLQGSSGASQPPVLAIVNVKDDARADKFLGDTLNTIQQMGVSFTKSSDHVNNQLVTLYANQFLNLTLAHLPGELALGTTPAVNTMLDDLKNNQPTLGADPKFQKTMALLSSDSDISLFLNPAVIKAGLSAYMAAFSSSFGSLSGTPAPAASNNMQQALNVLDAYNGLAMDLRAANKTLAVDVATSFDSAKLASAMSAFGFSSAATQMQPLSGKLPAQIPSNATFFFSSSNLARIYATIQAEISAMSKQPNLSARQKQQIAQMQQRLTQFEQGLKSAFNLDLAQDVLSWLGGDYGVYGVLDPNSDLSSITHQPFPLDIVLIVSASDVTKAQSFVDKLNAGLKARGLTATAAGTGLYTLTVPSAKGAVKLGYGVSNGAFLLTTAGALAAASAATGGTNTLSTSNTSWKNATASLPSGVTALGFVDLSQIGTFVQGMMAAQSSSSGNQDTRIAGALFNEFESVLFYSATAGDGSAGTASLEFNLK